MVRAARALRQAFIAGLALGAAGVQACAAAELVMFEREGCVWCRRWDEEIGPLYPRTQEGRRLPLRRVNLDRGEAGLRPDPPVRYTPTFVLMDAGREIGRITGYINDDAFWGLLGALLARLDSRPLAGTGE